MPADGIGSGSHLLGGLDHLKKVTTIWHHGVLPQTHESQEQNSIQIERQLFNKVQTMAAYEGQPVAKRKRTTHEWDSEQRQKHSKNDIDYNDRQQTWSYDIPKENKTAAIANDKVSNEVAEILQSLRSEANRSGRSHPRSSSADQPMPGPHLRNSPTYDAPHWTWSRHAGLFEEMDDELPKTTDTDWTIPQRKQDSQGQGYYWSGKMNGNRKIWTKKYPATWPPRKCLEEEAREEMGGTFPFDGDNSDKANNAITESETVGEDESIGEDMEQCAGTRDTGSAICDGLKRKWMATGNFWED